MPKARKLINEASFGPETLKMLGDVFDKVWAVVAPEFGDDHREIEAARIRLATIVLKLAKDGQLGPLEITRTAGRLIRQPSRTSNVDQ
jgi:hypothetical protein